MDLSSLKSGTDLRGTALDILGGKPNLGRAEAYAAASAFALWLRRDFPAARRIAVGCDSRLSSPMLKEAVIDALVESGCTALDCGMCSTPSMFMTTVLDPARADGAIMITASHHPADKNGLKFFTRGGGIGHRELDEIVAVALSGERLSERGNVETGSFFDSYCAFLRGKITAALGENKPLAGMKIAVDAGNGAGGFYVRRVLEPLGADCSGSRFLNPDGNFPNHAPNPENPAAMHAACEAVLSSGSDLGVIFDTDVDRAAIVSADGEEINRNRLIALISAIILRDEPGATIVTDSVTSDGLAEFIARRGGVHRRYRRGYRNVIDEAIRLESEGVNAPLAIETSGHAALKENYFLDDGAYLVTRLIIEAVKMKRAGGNLLDLIADLRVPLEEKEARLSFSTDKWRELGSAIIEDVKGTSDPRFVVAPDNAEGVRVSVPEQRGWFLIRMSVHDPIMPINIESDLAGGVSAISEMLYALLSRYPGLNPEKLK